MNDMIGKAGLILPQEMVNHIIKDVLQDSRYNLAKPDANNRFWPSRFVDPISPQCPPAYAGLLVASKAVSEEVQRLLYKDGVFRAYLNRSFGSLGPVLRRSAYDRMQKVELVLELNNSRFNIIRTWPENYYRDWFDVFGSSRVIREHCHIKVTYFVSEQYGRPRPYPWTRNNDMDSAFCQRFIEGCSSFVGFKVVVLELEKNSGRAPAGHEFEEFKEHLENVLQPTLGSCIRYNRENIHFMEFHPRQTVEAISPNQSPSVGLVDN